MKKRLMAILATIPVLALAGPTARDSSTVQGAESTGTTVVANPVQVGGVDGTGKVQPVKVGSDGTVQVSGTVTTGSGAATSGAYGETLVSSSTATLVGGLSGRQAITVQNNGPNEIRCGFDNTVTTSTGMAVPANGGTLSVPATDAVTVYCIAKTATQLTGAATNYMEVK